MGIWATTARAVLFDRDGTLIQDVPYNGDPDRVEPMPGAVDTVQRLRRAGLRLGVVTNQSGIARGLIDLAAVRRVQERVDALFGPFDVWAVCPHGEADGCACRKPAPGLVRKAAGALGVEPRECVVIGDIGSDIGAAEAAGAASILVPTAETLRHEIDEAPCVAPGLSAAADLVLAGAVAAGPGPGPGRAGPGASAAAQEGRLT
jgi:D-glycero-D-manno-heptose 1,7-bisphosphate phosphatase